MDQIVKAGGPLAAHVKQVYLDAQPPAGTSMWSMMWDELLVASLIDPTVIKKSETMYLDVDTDHGSKYGDTVVWKKPEDMPTFFLPYSGPRPVDREKWMGHLMTPAGLHPASVQTEVDVEKFVRFFVLSLSR
jgi:inosine-uridine nucleoside N-ribohydrolase